jgi:hypothetical protein
MCGRFECMQNVFFLILMSGNCKCKCVDDKANTNCRGVNNCCLYFTRYTTYKNISNALYLSVSQRVFHFISYFLKPEK